MRLLLLLLLMMSGAGVAACPVENLFFPCTTDTHTQRGASARSNTPHGALPTPLTLFYRKYTRLLLAFSLLVVPLNPGREHTHFAQCTHTRIKPFSQAGASLALRLLPFVIV
uniref:Putative secreted protein n=1 Tax=Anopheles darlingi TaxID=43151 RepID=A0A2M4DF01_ANODA